MPPMLNGLTLRTHNRLDKGGVGVGIYLHSTLNFIVREDLKCNSSIFESVFAEIDYTAYIHNVGRYRSLQE